jgi:hypothetical protein
MKRSIAMIMLAAAVVPAALGGAGCKDKKASEGSAAATGAAPATGAAAPPFTGELTAERVLGARDLVKPFDPWDVGFARLQAQVGAPTRIDGARHVWAIVEGDTCAYFYVTKDDGADYKVEGTIVGTVQAPARTAKDGSAGDHNACLEAAGVAVGPPEDPAAAGPPADGSAVALADLRKVVIAGRSKWKDQRIKVAAIFGGVSTSTSGGDSYVTASLTVGTDDSEKPLSCSLAKNQAVPPALTPGTAVIAEGTVAIQEWTKGSDVTLEAALTDCTLLPARSR